MKTKKLHVWKSFFMLFVAFMLASASFTVKADSEYCRALVGTTTSRVFLSVETNAQGQIVFSIFPFDPTAETGTAFTAFRNSGWSDARILPFTVNGNANTANMYFTRTINTAKTQVTFTPVTGMMTPGDIVAGTQTMEWRTPLNGNAYGNVAISYTYGSSCGAQPTFLADPTNLALDASNQLTFTSDPAASSNSVFVYSGSIPMYEQQNFTSGSVVNYATPGNYTLKVRSIGDNNLHLSSNYSAAIPFTVAGDLPVLGNSEFCHKYWDPTGDGGFADNSDAVFVTWETLADGSMKVTLDGFGGNNPSFRGGSFSPANLYLGPTALGTNYVDITNAGNVVTITPKSGVTIPDGLTIRYNGVVAFLTAGGLTPHSNLFPTADFTYTYKTNCAGVVKTKLAAPTNVAVDGNGILTFDAAVNASTYNAFVYLGETVVYSQIPVASGDKLNFPLPGTFNVKVVAVPDVTSSEYLDSDPSASYSWAVNYQVPATLPVSTYCHWELDPNVGGNTVTTDADAAYWTWTTDALGQIVISIEGKITPATTAFRSGGMTLSGFKIGGVPATLLLDKVGNNTGLTQTFKAKPGITLLPGLSINYSGQVEYQVLPTGTPDTAIDDLYPTLTFSNPYIYGSNCSGEAAVLPAPANLVMSNDNKLSFDAVANAVSYKVYVYDATGASVYTQELFTSDSVISYAVPGHLKVKVQAIGNAGSYLSSGFSESVNWSLIAALAKPTGLSIDTENKLSFGAVTSALSYTVTVYQNAADANALVTIPNFVIGSVVNMGTNPYGTYYVKVKAVGDGDVILDSPVSDTYTWNFQTPFVCNLLLTHPLVKGSDLITYIKPDNSEAATAPFFATTWNWTPSANYTFSVTDNVVSIHLGDATIANWQAQFRVIPTTPIILKPGASYNIKAKVKTSKSTSMYAKIFDNDDNTFIELVARQNLNSPDGTVFEIPSIVPDLTRIFQILFDFGPSPADLNIEISDIVICGEELLTGTKDVQVKGISLYPVPANNELYINGISGMKVVRVVDVLGKIVSVQQTANKVDISGLNKGIYLLSVDNQMIKFVKE